MENEKIKFKTSLFGYNKEEVLKFLKKLILENSKSELEFKNTIALLESNLEKSETVKKDLNLKLQKIKELEEIYICKNKELTDLLIEIKSTKENEINLAKKQGEEIRDKFNKEISILKNEKISLTNEVLHYKNNIFANLKNDLLDKKNYIDKIINQLDESISNNLS